MSGIMTLIVSLLGFAGDEISKEWARVNLAGKDKSFFGGRIKLMLRENRGFAMNRFESNRKAVVTVSAAVFAVLLVFYIPVVFDSGYRAVRPGFSLLFAGAAGNVYDRLVKGRVTDFINVSFFNKIVFNIADVLIVVGGLMAVIGDITGGN